MIRPTPWSASLLAVSVPVAAVIVILWPRVWYVSFLYPFVLLLFILADALAALPNRRLRCALDAPARLYVGRPAEVGVSLACEEYRRRTTVRLLLDVLGASGEVVEQPEATSVLEGGTLDLRLTLTPTRRGRLVLDALWVVWRGPLGLVEQYRRDATVIAIDVLPDVKDVHREALSFFSHNDIYGVKAQRRRGEGTEYENLCEYAVGMDNRLIDWKHSARHRKLLCKEFRQERNHRIVLGFDTGYLMTEPIEGVSKLDLAIKSALLLGWVSLRCGDMVGGCAFDARFGSYLEAGSGMSSFAQLQRFTAALDYHTDETNFAIGMSELYAKVRRRSLIVLFSEFVDAISAELMLESLQLLVRRHLVVFVTMRDPMLASLKGAAPDGFADAARAAVADDLLRDRSTVLERVARLGVQTLDMPTALLSTALLNRYLLVKQRGLL